MPELLINAKREKRSAKPTVCQKRERWATRRSSTLTSTLLEHGLADEMVLFVYPLLLAKGKRIFAEGTSAGAFELVSTKSLPSGIVINSYKGTGPLKKQA